jgi:hypothetical protein
MFTIYKIDNKINGKAEMNYVILEKSEKPISKEHLQKIIDKFVPFAKKHLELKSVPKILFTSSEKAKEIKSFGQHIGDKIKIKVEDRHPMDVLRTIAHELVHHKQDEEGKESGNSHGKPIINNKRENEANKEAGIMVRKFAHSHSDLFKLGSVE